MEQLDQRELARAMNASANTGRMVSAMDKHSAEISKAIRDSGTAWWMAVLALVISAVAAAAQVYPLLK